MQILNSPGIFSPILSVGTGAIDCIGNVYRGTADGVGVVVTGDSNALAEFFQHHDGRASDLHTTTLVGVIQDIGAVIRQHRRSDLTA